MQLMPHSLAAPSRRRPFSVAPLLACGALLLVPAVPGCAPAPPPRPEASQPAAPPPPVAPMSRADYLQGGVTFAVDEIFVGAPTYRSVLHWLVTGKLNNHGNRTLRWVQVLFRFEETGHLEKAVVLDTFQEQLPLAPGKTLTVNVPAAQLEAGVVGPIDPAKVATLPPPTVTVQVIDVKFEDEAP